MADIIDFRSRKNITQPQDYAANDAEAEHGRYVGVLPKHEAKVIRDVHDDLARLKAQIDALVQDFETKWEGAAYMKSGALTFLGVDLDEFDPHSHELYVDKDGHCWILNVNHPKAGEFLRNKEGGE